MKRLALLVAAIAVLALALPVTAGAADTVTYGFSGKNADAWSGVGEQMSSDAWSSVNVFGGTMTSKQVGTERIAKIRSTMGFAGVDQYTPATATEPAVLRSVWVNGDPAMFSANRELNAAALEFVGVGEILTWVGEMPWDSVEGWIEPDTTTEIVASVDVDWVGQGSLWREGYSSRMRTDNFFSTDRSNSVRRSAVASGLIVGSDGTVYFDGTFDDASIYDTRGTGHFKGEWPLQ